jgi:hypothetical protein
MDRDEGFRPVATSLPQPTDYSKGLEISTARRQAKAEYSAERARLLFGQFRKGDANDPDTYSASIAAVLAEYPDEVVRQATDPRTGLGSRCDWLPTVKEVHDFCRSIVEAEERATKRENDLQWQFASRAEYEKTRKKAPMRWALQARGFLQEKPVEPLPANELHAKMEKAKALYGAAVGPSSEARTILVKAGYRT